MSKRTEGNRPFWPDRYREAAAPVTDEALALKKAFEAARGLPVEAPAGAAERVRRRLGEPARSTRIVWLQAAGFVAAWGLVFAAVFLAWRFLRPSPDPLGAEVWLVRGTAALHGRDLREQEWQPVLADPTSRLTIGKQSLALLRDASLTRMLVREDTEVTFLRRSEGGNRSLRLVRGEVVLRVPPDLDPGDLPVVLIPGGQVRVQGTVYAVGVAGQRTTVSVWEGRVELACRDGTVVVERGSQALCDPEPAAGGAPRGLDPEEQHFLEFAPLEDAPAPESAEVVEAPLPGAALEPAGSPPPARTAAGEPSGRRVAHLAAPVEANPASGEPAPARVLPQDAGVEAVSFDFEKQEGRLVALVEAGGEPAEVALFSLASLRLDHLRRVEEAIATFREYLRLYPRGRFAGEAHRVLFVALCRQGDFEAAARHGQAAWEQLPAAQRGPLGLQLAETYQARLNRPDRAIPFYLSLAEGDSPEAERAAFLLIECYQKTGDEARARTWLERARSRFPESPFLDGGVRGR